MSYTKIIYRNEALKPSCFNLRYRPLNKYWTPWQGPSNDKPPMMDEQSWREQAEPVARIYPVFKPINVGGEPHLWPLLPNLEFQWQKKNGKVRNAKNV